MGAIGPIIAMLLLSIISIFIISIGYDLLQTTFELDTWIVITIMFFGWPIPVYIVGFIIAILYTFLVKGKNNV